MDQHRFDQLTRAWSRRRTRRDATRLVSLAIVGLGVGHHAAADGEAKHGAKKQHKGKVLCEGKWVERCARDEVMFPGCFCNCPVGQEYSRCGECVPEGAKCCLSEKPCGDRCISRRDCCDSTERTCGKNGKVSVCVERPGCCPGEAACPIAAEGCCNTAAGEECAALAGCCNTLLGKAVCDGKWCCAVNEKCCPGQGCIPKAACCDDAGPCPSEPSGCCAWNEQCCPNGGCRPLTESCCASGETNCGGLRCCPENTTCTVGTYDGQPRAKCCGAPHPGSSMTPCDGECCEHDEAIICCAGRQNPCRAETAGC